MEAVTIARDLLGYGGAVAFAIVFGVVVAVRRTSIDDVKERLIVVENDLRWIKKALGYKEDE